MLGRAVLDKQALIARRLSSMADKLCAGSYVPLLSHLVQGGLTPEELRALREQVDALDDEGEPRRRS